MPTALQGIKPCPINRMKMYSTSNAKLTSGEFLSTSSKITPASLQDNRVKAMDINDEVKAALDEALELTNSLKTATISTGELVNAGTQDENDIPAPTEDLVNSLSTEELDDIPAPTEDLVNSLSTIELDDIPAPTEDLINSIKTATTSSKELVDVDLGTAVSPVDQNRKPNALVAKICDRVALAVIGAPLCALGICAIILLILLLLPIGL